MSHASRDPKAATFPDQLDRVRDGVRAQTAALGEAARAFADAIESGGVVHVYANGHSRIAAEELVVRLGALTGFHPLLAPGLGTFDGVVGARGIRVNQSNEKLEGLGAAMLDEYDIAPDDVLLVVSATGTTPAAVDIALEFARRHPKNMLVALTSKIQSRDAEPHHSSGLTLFHVVERAERALLLDNCMPMGDLSVEVDGHLARYQVCPLSSVGALTVVQSLNELTVRELDARGYPVHVLGNMHLGDVRENYDGWTRDQRRRYARALSGRDGSDG